ncbi:MAG: UvrD-helicase domain-containing protein [Verrucomicrobiae bacterium]|nr:UvrD-helicase domain-containing protein [Verrucomicrobiae bacterium]
MAFPNNEQRAVIEAVGESLLVLAPMGTGKTRTAAAAIDRAMETGIEPEQILGLTFTNRAADAMRTAVAEALPEQSHRIHLYNLHALCARLLREESQLAGLPPDFGILDEDESLALMWEMASPVERREFKNKPQEAMNEYERVVFRFLTAGGDRELLPCFRRYRDAMRRDGNVDFTGLIGRTHYLLHYHDEARLRWQARYRWLLVDEVQDINLAEYRIISVLGAKAKCLKFFGDTHQTIYEWRFAQPKQVIETFVKEFQPRSLALRINYRCSPTLIAATNAVRQAYVPSDEPLPEAGVEEDGEEDAVAIRGFSDPTSEINALADKLISWKAEGISPSGMAVLARQRRTLIEASAVLRERGVAHLVAEDFDFFRRKEIKDVMAALEHCVSPFRRHPILRLLKLFGATEHSLSVFQNEAQGTGLHWGYVMRGEPGDPLKKLLDAWREGRVVALDTETTGLDPAVAEVVQLAWIGQNDGEKFDAFLRPAKSVGTSVKTHGFTDEFLAREGGDPRETLARGLKWGEGRLLSGHNLAFDLRLLRDQTARLGLQVAFPEYFDTMPLVAAVLDPQNLPGLRLEMAARALGLEVDGTHHALVDARLCRLILEKLMPGLVNAQKRRLRVLAEMPSDLALAVRKVSTLLRRVQELESGSLSIPVLIQEGWKLLREIPGPHDYRQNKAREANVNELGRVAEYLVRRRGGALSLPLFIEQVALSRQDMMMEVSPDAIRLLTGHAAKGLEFDAVALPNLIKPWGDYTPEEARVFYVMITRARRKLWMTWPAARRLTSGAEVPAERLKYLETLEKWMR